MSHKKVLEVAHKFAENNLQDKFQSQKEMLETFALKYRREFEIVLDEINTALFAVKKSNLDRDALKEFINISKNLVHIYKSFDEKNPYEAANKLVNYIYSKETLDVIKNLHFILKRIDIPFNAAESITMLAKFVKWTKAHMNEKPLIPSAEELLSKLPSGMDEVVENRTSGPEEATNPGIKKK